MNVVFEDDRGILGETVDRKPRVYHFSKMVPVVSSFIDFFDIFDTYNRERGY